MPVLQMIGIFLAGLCVGLGIGYINSKLLVSGVRTFGDVPFQTAKRKLYTHYGLRLLLIFIAFLLTFHWLPALLGAALGLLIMQKTLIVHYINLSKGVKK